MKKTYQIKRFPSSDNKSLKAWSAADELLLHHVSTIISDDDPVAVMNDRFGYLSVHLSKYYPKIICNYRSQEDAIVQNFSFNELSIGENQILRLTDDVHSECKIVLIKTPKSLDLFHFFLIKAHQLSNEESVTLCGFMTRHFTPQLLSLASKYFEEVDQSKAVKKSRVLILKKPKKVENPIVPIHQISFENHRSIKSIYQQYYGVFSSRHIDYATQFLLENLELKETYRKILDLASGNGVIAHQIRMIHKEAEIHLMDDSYLALASSKLNLPDQNTFFHYNYTLKDFEKAFFDLIVCNPPFHFEYENTIEISLDLFKGVKKILKPEGLFILVANRHLNYKTHLSKIFNMVATLNQNSKFEVLQCSDR